MYLYLIRLLAGINKYEIKCLQVAVSTWLSVHGFTGSLFFAASRLLARYFPQTLQLCLKLRLTTVVSASLQLTAYQIVENKYQYWQSDKEQDAQGLL